MQVYTQKRNKPFKENLQIVKEYAGILPDHNEIGIASFDNGTSHTTLTLNTLWKAPFYFNLSPLSYSSTSAKDFSVSSQSYYYSDITFCYATVLTGEITIPADNPIFSSAQIIQNASDYTLRLHLKKTGGFYGWDAEYNENGQLVFEFLNPAKITTASNEYGYDLTGTRILIDVGHGGIDPGAVSFSSTYTEAAQNLNLAYKIKAELESIGATVYMTRTDNSTSSVDQKLMLIKQLKPDYCIAIHHNSSNSSSANGFDSYYTNPFARNAAEYVHYYTNQSGIYSKASLGWHYYFMSRSRTCPVVLTENGYMSNWSDYSYIIDENTNLQKAKAITKGIAYYFYSIQ
jgi:N-acetylmuramoyl-L-alanine amidase